MADPFTESLEKIIAVMPGVVFWKSVSGKYLGCNDNAAKISRLNSREEFIGKTIYDLFDASVAAKVDAIDNQVLNSQIEHVEEEIGVDVFGNAATYLTRKVPILDDAGKTLGLVGISVDITERKQMEQALIKAKEAADAANQAKTLFLANMSHDLKTPLSGIISTAEYLCQMLTDPETQSRANDILQSGLRLLELLIEIIEISKLDTKAFPEYSAFSPQELITDIIQLIKPVVINKDLVFKIIYQDAIPDSVIGDRWQLYRIILNLLSNAIKFTCEGSITLSVLLESQEQDEVILKIIVKDTGIGIPADKQTVIFEQFTRLTNAYDSAYKGTGLGLYIVKTFVESMRGAVNVVSVEGEGSTFSCLIPLKTAIVMPSALTQNTFTETQVSASNPLDIAISVDDHSSAFKGVEVLLVEDNLIAARATKDILQSLGSQVVIASSGQEAIALFKKHPYHFVYLDIGLPDMSGCAVSQQLRLVDATVPIVALSAHVDAAIKEQCLVAGMNDALTKPLLRGHARHNMQKFLKVTAPENTLHELAQSDSSGTVIDFALAASIMSCDRDEAKKNVAWIIEQLPVQHQVINEAYVQNDRASLEKAVHKLHGGLLYGGMVCLQKAVAALERAALHASEVELAQYYGRYEAESKRLLSAYAEALEQEGK